MELKGAVSVDSIAKYMIPHWQVSFPPYAMSTEVLTSVAISQTNLSASQTTYTLIRYMCLCSQEARQRAYLQTSFNSALGSVSSTSKWRKRVGISLDISIQPKSERQLVNTVSQRSTPEETLRILKRTRWDSSRSRRNWITPDERSFGGDERKSLSVLRPIQMRAP